MNFMLDQVENYFTANTLVPAIIQDYYNGRVLMLGYMNLESFKLSLESHFIWFYSRSKKRLWKKGESSGNVLKLISYSWDCDQDALLFQVIPQGNTCHTGTQSCFSLTNNFSNQLVDVIKNRFNTTPNLNSYISNLKEKGNNKIFQKVGEEAVEFVIEGIDSNSSKNLIVNEAADLLFHYLLALESKSISLDDIWHELHHRNLKKQ